MWPLYMYVHMAANGTCQIAKPRFPSIFGHVIQQRDYEFAECMWLTEFSGVEIFPVCIDG